MNRVRSIYIIIFNIFIILSSRGVSAEANSPYVVMHPDWMDKRAVSDKVLEEGFTKILSVNDDVTGWLIKARKGIKIYDLHVDPKSGAITSQKLSRDNELKDFDDSHQRPECLPYVQGSCQGKGDDLEIRSCKYTGENC